MEGTIQEVVERQYAKITELEEEERKARNEIISLERDCLARGITETFLASLREKAQIPFSSLEEAEKAGELTLNKILIILQEINFILGQGNPKVRYFLEMAWEKGRDGAFKKAEAYTSDYGTKNVLDPMLYPIEWITEGSEDTTTFKRKVWMFCIREEMKKAEEEFSDPDWNSESTLQSGGMCIFEKEEKVKITNEEVVS